MRLIKIFITIICYLLCNTIFSQNGNYLINDFDKNVEISLINLKKFPKKDSLRVKALKKIYTNGIFLSQKKKLMKYANESGKISKEIGYVDGSCSYYYWLAVYNKSDSNIDLSMVYLDSIYYISKNENTKSAKRQRAYSDELKGNIYYSQENYYAAINYFLKALIYFDTDYEMLTLTIYEELSEVFFKLNNYKKSKEYSLQLIKIAESNKIKESKLEKDVLESVKSDAYINLASIAIAEKNYVLAEKYLSKISKKQAEIISLDSACKLYLNKGQLAFNFKKIDSSEIYYNEAYGLAKDFDHPDFINDALYYLSKIALEKNNDEKAKVYAEQNLTLAKNQKDKSHIIGALKNLANYYNKKGDNNKSYSLLNESITLKDSLISEESVKQINRLNAIYEKSKTEQKILKLSLENEKKTTTNQILIGASIGLLLIILLTYNNFKNKQKLQNLKISKLEKDRQLLSIDAMLKGQEEERSRIAKDLHDGLGGLLSGTKLSFTTMKDNLILTPENTEKFDNSLNMLDKTMNDLRKIAHNLMPESLVKFGLDEALKDFCNSIQSGTNTTIKYQKIGIYKKLNNTYQTFIYRIIQELVNNALKHSQAKEILVQLAIHKDNIHITVEDDGIGYNKNSVGFKKGIGLANIEYRVNYLNGIIDTVSSPNNGTSVNIEFKI